MAYQDSSFMGFRELAIRFLLFHKILNMKRIQWFFPTF